MCCPELYGPPLRISPSASGLVGARVQRDGKECALSSFIHGTSSDCNIPTAATPDALSTHTQPLGEGAPLGALTR